MTWIHVALGVVGLALFVVSLTIFAADRVAQRAGRSGVGCLVMLVGLGCFVGGLSLMGFGGFMASGSSATDAGSGAAPRAEAEVTATPRAGASRRSISSSCSTSARP